MKHFLIVYSKEYGLITLEAFPNEYLKEAQDKQRELQRVARLTHTESDNEIVILHANSVAEIFATHSRYFM